MFTSANASRVSQQVGLLTNAGLASPDELFELDESSLELLLGRTWREYEFISRFWEVGRSISGYALPSGAEPDDLRLPRNARALARALQGSCPDDTVFGKRLRAVAEELGFSLPLSRYTPSECGRVLSRSRAPRDAKALFSELNRVVKTIESFGHSLPAVRAGLRAWASF